MSINLGEDKNLHEVYLFHLEKAYKQFKKYKTAYLKKVGVDITSDQWILLKSISEEEGINQRTLAEKCFKEPASVTRILDLLEKKGLVERQSITEDRRSYELYTTQQGKELVEKMLPIAVEIREKGVVGLTEEQVINLNKLLIKLFENYQ